jgi:hypothetical protein
VEPGVGGGPPAAGGGLPPEQGRPCRSGHAGARAGPRACPRTT